jgi:MarR family 2-MHQ and catechol resistance regulon transcriptional repressor
LSDTFRQLGFEEGTVQNGLRRASKYTYEGDLSIDERTMMAIVRTAELVKKELSKVFKNYGVTFAQYNALRFLGGSENGQNTMTNTSKIMLVTGANLTGIAKRLERSGLLIRKSDPDDERVTVLEITPKGRQTLINISLEKDENLERFFSIYTDDEKSEMSARLVKVIKQISTTK